MNSFKQFYNEGVIGDRSDNVKIADWPMFTVYYGLDSWHDEGYKLFKRREYGDRLYKLFAAARRHLTKLGFPSMHVNVIISNIKNNTTFGGVAAGSAFGNPAASRKNSRYMRINKEIVGGALYSGDTNLAKTVVRVIVHEWAHLWMFNQGKAFRDAVTQYWEALYYSNIDNTPTSNKYKDIGMPESLRGHVHDMIKSDQKVLAELAKLLKHPDWYGLTSPDETWAVAIEKFFDLHPYQQKRILEIMQTPKVQRTNVPPPHRGISSSSPSPHSSKQSQ